MDEKKLAIIASKGTLDWAYPPFILASTAAALGYETQIFFTFYGLQLLKKDVSDLKVSPLGNPGMPMKMPFGPKWLRDINWSIPNAVQAIVPGFESLATALMKMTIKNNGGGHHPRAENSLPGGRRQVHRLPDDRGTVRIRAQRLHQRH